MPLISSIFIVLLYIKGMAEKIIYSVLEIHSRRIRELVESKKYRNPEDFLKNAIEILLTWESDYPEECMEIMKGLMPLSLKQEKFMKQSMDSNEIKNQFGTLEIDNEEYETTKQKELSLSDEDHLKLRNNFQHTKKFIKSLKITTPKNQISYDGYPLLSGFYSRLLPVKVVLATLCHQIERKKDSKIELKELRVHAFDIAEEIAETLIKYENEHSIPRNKKTSTGFPKRSGKDEDEEKIIMAQKRFKDKFIGRVRKSRTTKNDHFEGALSALGLVTAFNENEKIFVSLTALGKKFFLMDNPIVEGEYEKGSLTKQEAEFILKELIPQRELEYRFVKTVISVVEKFQKGKSNSKESQKEFEKITHSLDKEIKNTALNFLKENPKMLDLYNLNHLDRKNETTERKITQWRLATMGRLTEMNVVNWTINENGDSEYSLI